MENTENLENAQNSSEMPENQTPSETTPQKTIWQKVWAWLDLLEIEKRVAAITSITVKFAIFCTVVAGGFVIYAELTSESYMIEAFHVPESLEKNGFTGIALANQLNDQIQKIQFVDEFDMRIYLQTNENSSFEVQMVGFALPIQSIINYVGKITGIDKRKKVTGDIRLSQNTLFLHLRLGGEKTQIIAQKMDSLSEEKAIEKLLKQSTYSILKKYNPIFLATNLSEMGKTDEAITIAKYALYHDTENKKWALTAWGRALSKQNKPEEAINKFKEALALDSLFVPAINSWGSALRRQNKHYESITKRKKALKINPDYTLAYTAIGLNYYSLKKYDSAMMWLQEGIKRNPKDGYGYGFLASVYEAKGDIEKFYDYLELACENGFNLWTRLEDEPYPRYVQEPRFQALIEKYRVE